MTQAITSVFLVDDHEVVRAGLRALLAVEQDLEVVGEIGTAKGARERIAQAKPDVVVMDVRLPDGDGVEICRDVCSDNPDTRVVMLTSYADDEALLSAILAGASGFLLKQVRSIDLARSIRTVATGASLIQPSIRDRVKRRLQGEGDDADSRILARLTNQERKVLSLVAEGLTNRQIAERIHLAEKTVKNYVSNVLNKLGVSRRSEAAVWAVRQEHHAAETVDHPPPNWP